VKGAKRHNKAKDSETIQQEVVRICGIIGCVIRDPRGVKKNLRWIYISQQKRGKKGAGFSIYRPGSGTFRRVRAKNPATLFKHRYLDQLDKGDLVLFHHRLPTSSPNMERCNHPIVNEDRSLHLVHNGWVTSASYHYDLLREKGHVFETEIAAKQAKVSRKPKKKQMRSKAKAEVQLQTQQEWAAGQCRAPLYGPDGMSYRVQKQGFRGLQYADNSGGDCGGRFGRSGGYIGIQNSLGARAMPSSALFTDSEILVHELEEELAQLRGGGASGSGALGSGGLGGGGNVGVVQPPADSQVLKALDNMVEGLYGALTFAFILRGVDKIFIFRGSPPCFVYTDSMGNTWFSSEYPKPSRGNGTGTGIFRLVRNLQHGEAAAISLRNGYQRLGVISTCSYNSHYSYGQGFGEWNYPANQATLTNWASGSGRGTLGKAGLTATEPVGQSASFDSHDSVVQRLDDAVFEALEESVANVWEQITDDEWGYGRRYVPLSFVQNLLKAEAARTGVGVPGRALRKAALDIWEAL
jgi:hypothetical protein